MNRGKDASSCALIASSPLICRHAYGCCLSAEKQGRDANCHAANQVDNTGGWHHSQPPQRSMSTSQWQAPGAPSHQTALRLDTGPFKSAFHPYKRQRQVCDPASSDAMVRRASSNLAERPQVDQKQARVDSLNVANHCTLPDRRNHHTDASPLQLQTSISNASRSEAAQIGLEVGAAPLTVLPCSGNR